MSSGEYFQTGKQLNANISCHFLDDSYQREPILLSGVSMEHYFHWVRENTCAPLHSELFHISISASSSM